MVYCLRGDYMVDYIFSWISALFSFFFLIVICAIPILIVVFLVKLIKGVDKKKCSKCPYYQQHYNSNNDL